MIRQAMLVLAALALTAGAPLAARPAAAQVRSDADFVREAAQGGLAEVELGRLAADRAEREDVRSFGRRMVQDHGAANAELAALAARENLAVPNDLDARHQAVRDRLAGLQGAAFDRAYMDEMVEDHRQDVALFEWHARHGQDPDLRAWSAGTLPVLRDHLRMAQDIVTRVAGVAPAAPAASPATSAVTVIRTWCDGVYHPGLGSNFAPCPGR